MASRLACLRRVFGRVQTGRRNSTARAADARASTSSVSQSVQRSSEFWHPISLRGGAMETGHRVVILGGGFGGLYAAQALKKAPVQITVLDRRNFHLFQPLLYQVATGSLSPGEVASPPRSVLHNQKNTRVLLGEARDLDAAGKRVILDDGQSLEYDSLIVATGSTDSYFGHDD